MLTPRLSMNTVARNPKKPKLGANPRAGRKEKSASSNGELGREANSAFQVLLNAISQGVVYQNRDGKIIRANPAAERILGMSLEQMQGRTSLDPLWKAIREDHSDFPGDTHPAVIARKSGKPVRNVVMGVFSFRDQDYRWLRVDAIPLFHKGQETPYQVLAIFDDITEYRRAQERAEISEQRFRALIEHSTDAISLADENGRITYASPAAGHILGVPPERLVGHTTFDGIHPDDLQAAQRLFAQIALAPGQSAVGEFRVRHKDGTWRWVEGTGTNLLLEPSVQGMLANFRDITERKQAGQETRFQSKLLDMVEQAIIATNLEGTIIYWNRFAEKLYGWSAEEVLGKNIARITQTSATQAQAVEIMDRLQKGESWSGEFQVKRRDGSFFPALVTDSPIYNDAGQFVGIVGTSVDITDRNRAEEALAASEQRFRALIEKSAEAFALLRPDGTILYTSPSINRILGYDDSDDIQNLMQVIHPDDVKAVVMAFARIQKVPGASANLTIRGRHKDGSWRWLDSTGTNLLHDPAVNAVVANLRDVTERKEAETEIIQRAEEFAALYDTAHSLAIQQNLPAALQVISDRAKSLLHASTVAIHIYDPIREDLELVAGTGPIRPIGSRLEMGEGVAGYIAETREIVNSNAYDSWTKSRVPIKPGVLNAIVGVPMLHRGELVGVLIVAQDSSSRQFSYSDVRLLSLFASQAASAVVNARLLEQTSVRADQLALLYDAGLKLNKELVSGDQLEFLLQIAMKAVSGDRAVYYRFDAERNAIKAEVCLGYTEERKELLLSRVFGADQPGSRVSQVARERTPLNIPDITGASNWIGIDPDVRSGIWVPVEHEDELRGIIQVMSTHKHAFSPHDERLLVLFANQAAVALKNVRLFEQIRTHYEQTQSLRRIDEAISGSLDLNISMHVVLEQVVQRLQVDAADILVFNSKSHMLEFGAGRGFRGTTDGQTQMRPGLGLSGDKLSAGANIIRDTQEFNRGAWMASEGLIGYAALPLLAKGQVKGVLEVFSRAPLNPTGEWSEFFRTLATQTAIAIDHVQLFEDLQKSNLLLELAYDNTIEGWSRALDLRDKETEGHTRRVSEMTVRLAHRMGYAGAELLKIRRGALLHDIGKMGVPDAILLKPGPLTDEEWDIMHKHPEYAYDLLSPIEYLRPSLEIPYSHHERWDGAGYPRGLRGEAIPEAARIFAIVDVWDALISDRPYRPAWTKARAREFIMNESGKHFDPRIVEAFLDYLEHDEG